MILILIPTFKNIKSFLVITLVFSFFTGLAQNDSLLLLNSKPVYVRTFDGTRVISGQSVETLYGKNLQLMISHRFGTVAGGIHTFYGLDQANIRIGLDYGITDRLTVGIGRSSLKETYDGYLKYRILRQSNITPISLTLFASATAMAFKKGGLDTISNVSSRLTYVYQLMVAKKIGKLSVQFSPTLIYRNQIESYQDQYLVFSTGISGRYKLSRSLALTAEYFYVFSKYISDHYYNSASVGIDIQTGGHVFQLYLTNSQGMIEQFFILKTTDNWLKRGVRIGFNITRVFNFKRH